VKTVRYIGKAAHAGGAPHMGINALYAAQIALAGINAIRETFRDEDTIRVHPIITHGGSQVNVIPGEVRLETYVRGRTVDAIMDAQCARRSRAARGRARARREGRDRDAARLHADGVRPDDGELLQGDHDAMIGEENYRQIGHRTGSTDMGDLSQVMPILHPYIGGARAPATAPTTRSSTSRSCTSPPRRRSPRWRST
jgi:metal-dependent amidase/aminoacylase/carboxypeptidase family protein